ncbi:MAG: hypothetical protein ACYDHD_00395 [Vulcanimicrobiaceae bacterium]
MIRAYSRSAKLAVAVGAIALMLRTTSANAALLADPSRLYAAMQRAYARGQTQGWSFYNQEYYLATIFNAGRAYALQRPNDPVFAQLAILTVQIGAGLHYDPLTNHDASVWYVRQAANWVLLHSTDPALRRDATRLLRRANAVAHPRRLAVYANEDAAANLKEYPRDTGALVQQLEAAWRAWTITKNPTWRSLAFSRAANPDFPVAHLPTSFGLDFITAARSATAGVAGYTSLDAIDAEIFLRRLAGVSPLRVIAREKSLPASKILTTLAPADEYFGPLKMSILGIKNEIKRINLLLDYKYGNRESSAAVEVSKSIDAMHRAYPLDRALPRLLYEAYFMLGRLTTHQARSERARMRSILTIEYPDTPQAEQLLGITT